MVGSVSRSLPQERPPLVRCQVPPHPVPLRRDVGRQRPPVSRANQFRVLPQASEGGRARGGEIGSHRPSHQANATANHRQRVPTRQGTGRLMEIGQVTRRMTGRLQFISLVEI